MTTINESLTAKGYTPAALVPAALGSRRTINEIVIHHWGDRGQTHDGVVNFFVNGPGQTSAHYVVSAGRIDCLVSPEDAAWHCPGKNASSIGIECRPEATDADYATAAELIRTLRAQYGSLPLSKHRDWYNTACPGVWDLSRLDALAAGSAITPQSETITPLEEDVPNTPLELQEAVQTVLRDNPLVIGGRSVAAGVNQALMGIDVVNSNIAQLQTFIAQKLAPEAGVQKEGETYYLKGEDKPEVYALDVATGKLRHVQSAEFDVVTAIGIYKTVPQAKVDALLEVK